MLKQYELSSGQQINFGNPSVQFGHTVDVDVRAEIHQILSIQNIGGVRNYFGIPESLGGAKTKIFNFLIDTQQKRINGWTSKLLSKGGKEVLIKSVVSEMPTYVISCFRLPKGVTNKLTNAVANFWWSSNGQTRDMHWLAWKKLCRHKADGGLGFRVTEDFNMALLAKQLWRLIDYPNSLFARVFKGRYFRNGTLNSIRSYSPLYGWQSGRVSFRLNSWYIKDLLKELVHAHPFQCGMTPGFQLLVQGHPFVKELIHILNYW